MGQKVNVNLKFLFLQMELYYKINQKYCSALNKLDLYTVNNFDFSILNLTNSIEELYVSYLNFFNNFSIIKCVKYVDYQLNSCWTGFYDFDINLVNNNFLDLTFLFISINGVLIIIIILLLLSSILKINLTNSFYFLVSKVKNEIENNLSNYLDVFRLCVLTLFLINFFLSLYLYYSFSLVVLFSFLSVLTINVITIVFYMSIFNINIFVFIKGLLNSYKVLISSVIDNITLVTFCSRLLLQFLRLVICSVIFFNFHELSLTILNVLCDYYHFNKTDFNKTFFVETVRVVIEYLDMLVNFNVQYSIYIVSVMWLIPFLFTFIKKFLKIKNK